jgi:hypothetical protein
MAGACLSADPSTHATFVDRHVRGSTVLALFVWVMAGTAMWHFAVLVPDRFYRGVIGSFVVANAGAIAAGFAASGFVLPPETHISDAWAGILGAVAALVVSWFAGPRFDPARELLMPK